MLVHAGKEKAMSVIDKSIYEKLKNWCDYKDDYRSADEHVIYVNSNNRLLTKSTIRKVMCDFTEEDVHGEMYIKFYSAKSFYNNMHAYYEDIAECYRCKLSGEETIEEMIEGIPPTCGWLILIIEDMEELSDDAEKMEEMFKHINEFASNCPSIILVGNGDYQDVVRPKIIDDDVLCIYNQQVAPDREDIVYDTIEDQYDELDYCWNVVYEMLEDKYFDYEYFKTLYTETLEYIIPRVTDEYVYRLDIYLIEQIGKMHRMDNKKIQGCLPWEFDAAQKFSIGLHRAIGNRYSNEDGFEGEKISIDVWIKERDEDCGSFSVGGTFYISIDVSVDTACQKMDKLSETILGTTYKADAMQVWRFMQEEDDGKRDSSGKGFVDVGNRLNSAMKDIKKVVDNSFNKEPGRKVLRYKVSKSEDNN